MRQDTTLDGGQDERRSDSRSPEPAWALVVTWCVDPFRLGEALVLDARRRTPVTFGRGVPEDDKTGVVLVRQRPGSNALARPFDNPFLSRRHLELLVEGDGVHVANVGKRAMYVDGRETTREVVRPGDTVEIRGLVLFVCVRRPAVFPAFQRAEAQRSAFGEPDAHGIVGESAIMWDLRERVAFFGARQAHVLVLGESGTGKELVAQAMHATSARSKRKLVSRNAATLPTGLIDAELFGNVANYPNAGMPERPGIIGEAHESTLFLDEIGELPAESQTHLLRVLDEGGEYQRLGDAKRRRADLRVIAATNRAASELKHDLLARLALRLEVPGLNERRDDVMLVARHLLRRTASRDPAIGARFFEPVEGGLPEPRLSCELAGALVRHTYTTHVRELDALLWRALAGSRGEIVELTDDLRAHLTTPARPAQPREISADEIRAALERHGGVRERVWRELGLASRHALHRLMKKHGLASGSEDGDPEP